MFLLVFLGVWLLCAAGVVLGWNVCKWTMQAQQRPREWRDYADALDQIAGRAPRSVSAGALGKGGAARPASQLYDQDEWS